MLQQIADQIEPLGPDRDDSRAARNTVRLLQAISQNEIDANAEVEALKHYLSINQVEDRPLWPHEVT